MTTIPEECSTALSQSEIMEGLHRKELARMVAAAARLSEPVSQRTLAAERAVSENSMKNLGLLAVSNTDSSSPYFVR